MRRLISSYRYCSKTILNSFNLRPVGSVLLLRASSNVQRGVSGLVDAVSPKLEEETGAAARVSDAWPEWVELMKILTRRGYLEGGENRVRGAQFGAKDVNCVRTACLNFARERLGLIRFLSRKDIKVIAGSGCPSVDRKVVNSGKRLRAHVGINEGNVCSSCNLRGKCDRAYIKAREDEPGRTVDVMRFLLTYGLGVLDNKHLNNKTVTDSVRVLLKEMVDNSSQQLSSSDPGGKKLEIRSPCHPSPQENGRNSVPMKHGDWICPKCNFHNFSRNIKCLRCDELSQEKVKQIREDREHLPLKKGDWVCEKCNFLNFAKNTRCLLCTEKPPKRHLNPGEWECQSCNYVNFRRNMECLKCEHKRPKAMNSSNTTMQEGTQVGIGGINHIRDWRFVEEEEDHKRKLSSNEETRFSDFPILGGRSNLSQNVEKRERWKAEMSERRKRASTMANKDEDSKQLETPERFKFLECSDNEELDAWFGCEKKLENEAA